MEANILIIMSYFIIKCVKFYFRYPENRKMLSEQTINPEIFNLVQHNPVQIRYRQDGMTKAVISPIKFTAISEVLYLAISSAE